MAARLFIDLGDLFTKAVAVGPLGRRRLRYPSVVARRLLQQESGPADLLIDQGEQLFRPDDFDPARYRRSRSYPGAVEALEGFQGQGAVSGARYAGWQAAAYGADRQVLGLHPTEENVDALLHKALILGRRALEREVEVIFVVDAGPKAEAILAFARTMPRTERFEVRSVRQPEPRRVELALRGRVVDATECAARVLPAEVDPRPAHPLVLVDIGYFRSHTSIVSGEGCEYQEELDGLGVSQCVRRILRDEQSSGLVEDEFAVIRALEKSAAGKLEVAGRAFDVKRSLESARHTLVEELTSALCRIVVGHYGRRAKSCRAVAILGGGASVLGNDLAARLGESELGLDQRWVTPDPEFLLLNGAEQDGSPGG
jgi:hypothetical protein